MLKQILKCSAATFCAATMFASAAGAHEANQSKAYLYTGEGIYSELDYLCDAADGKRLIAVVKPIPNHASHALTFDRQAFANGKNHWVKLGEADAGAGQVRFPLVDQTSDEAVGHVHTINPGALGDPAPITFPALSSITIDGERSECRFDPDAVFFGVTDEVSQMILRDGKGGYVLKTWSVQNAQQEPEQAEFDSIVIERDGTRHYKFAIGHTLITIKVPSTIEKGGAMVTYEHDMGGSQSERMRAFRAAI